MASAEQKELANALKSLLKEHGFRKTAFNWHKTNGGVVQVINIQGSQWGKSFYINLGIFFQDIEMNEKPPEYKCHIRERIDAIVQDRERQIELENFESPLDKEVRFNELRSAIVEFALPWLERCSTKEGARHYLEKEKKHGLPVMESTKIYLGLVNS